MHAVEHKVRYEIVPYLVTAERLKLWPPLRIYILYAYLGEFFILLAGFGIAGPVMNFLNPAGAQSSTGKNSVIDSLVHFLGSGYLLIAALSLLVAWGLLKFYIRTEELEKRCNLLRSCMRQCWAMAVDLRGAVAEPNPMPRLLHIQQKLSDLVERNIVERAWVYAPFAPNIGPDVERECEDLIGPFRGNWSNREADERGNDGDQ